MTVEVGILNKQAVALATDSAVTIGGGRGYYNTANKLFSLSKHEPVAIMIYNNASFMGYPVEILIKDYRKKLGITKFDYLNEYWNDFLEYLKLFFNNNEDKDISNRYFVHLLTDLVLQMNQDIEYRTENLLDSFKSKENIKEEDIKKEINNLIEKYICELHGFYYQMQDDLAYIGKYDEIKYVCQNNIVNLINNIMGPKFPQHFIEQIIEIGTMLMTKKHNKGNITGIVIAGYGDKEYYPVLISGEFSGAFFNELKYIEMENIHISDNQNASIVPLAQKDVINTFIYGYDSNIIFSALDEIDKFKNNKEGIQNCDGITCLGDLKNNITNVVKNKANELHVQPILNTVVVAPKEELAQMAETLINLTSFRRKLSLDNKTQTVGGPIDVAVITKGDGLIWIKRKYYFDDKLNYNYFNNYFREENKSEYSMQGNRKE